ncbi:MAG TPA: hypothetical protein VKA19_07235 [Alphaproteobacteria bacterium]|nr:hypothetical protein [Alphaproteobacteria bacterium]
MRQTWTRLAGPLLLAAALSLTGCAKTTPTGGTSCIVFGPIRYSQNDTPETKRQVRGHNAAWDAICK